MIRHDVLGQLDDYRAENFPADSFMCVYGSSVYTATENDSDIDLFVSSQHDEFPNTSKQATFAAFVDDLHKREGRKTDEEVPYHNKLLYTATELREATALAAFPVDPQTQLVSVPPVVKTKEFLHGTGIKLRLALNALTTPHLVLGCAPEIQRHKHRAQIGSVLLGMSLVKTPTFREADVVDALVVGPNGETDEMHLGYKMSFPSVETYVHEVMDQGLWALQQEAIISKQGDRYVRPDDFKPGLIASYFTYLSL